MPTYEYKCDACGTTFERFQSITAPPVKKCPNCNRAKVRRLIGAGAGLIFKGSGFYVTDYRSDSYKSGAKSDGSTSSSSSASPASGNGNAAAAASGSSAPSTPAPKAENKPTAKKAAK